MRRKAFALFLVCGLLFSLLPAAALAQESELPTRASLRHRSHRWNPHEQAVYVEFENDNEGFAVAGPVIDLLVKDAQGKVVALGQAKLGDEVVLHGLDRASAKVPLLEQLEGNLPANPTFDFFITAKPLAADEAPPRVVNRTLFISKDTDGVPHLFGFAYLTPSALEEQVSLAYALVTLYDADGRVIWSEQLPLGGALVGKADSLALTGRFEGAYNLDVVSAHLLHIVAQ